MPVYRKALRSPVVEGAPLRVYGSSYVYGTGSYDNVHGYVTRLRDRLDMVLQNGGAGGARMTDAAGRMMDSAYGFPWVINSTGVLGVDCVTNDAYESSIGGGTIAFENSFKNGLRTCLAWSRLADFKGYTDGSVAYTGTWTTLPVLGMPGSACKYTATQNDYVECTVSGANIDLFILAPDSTIYTSGTMEVRVDGALNTSFVTTTQHKTAGALGQVFVAVTIPLRGIGTGAHTIRITNTTLNAHLWFVGWGIPATNPPTALVMKAPPLATPYTAANPSILTFNGYIDTVLAASPYNDGTAIVVDGARGWDSATMTHSDGLHPNDRGYAHLADACEGVLRGLTWRPGLNNR